MRRTRPIRRWSGEGTPPSSTLVLIIAAGILLALSFVLGSPRLGLILALLLAIVAVTATAVERRRDSGSRR